MDVLNQGALRLQCSRPGHVAAGLLITAFFATSCGSSGAAGGLGGGGAGGYGGYGGDSTGVTTTTTTTPPPPPPPPPPPEKEVESSFGAPVATGNYVWIANPTSGRV